LVRSHPSNGLLHRLIDTVRHAGTRRVETAEELLSALSANDQAALAELLAACAAIEADPGASDFVASVRRQQREGFLPVEAPLLPHLDQVSFDNAGQLAGALARFPRDAELRNAICRRQRQAIEARYGYAAGMRRVVTFVVDRLSARKPQRQAA
jgi:hypothetical protein